MAIRFVTRKRTSYLVVEHRCEIRAPASVGLIVRRYQSSSLTASTRLGVERPSAGSMLSATLTRGVFSTVARKISDY